MGRVLAALADHREATATARAARAFGDLLGARTEGIHVREQDDTDPDGLTARVGFSVVSVAPDLPPNDPHAVTTTLLRALSRPDVVLGVVGARSDPLRGETGHVALDLVDSLNLPILVVPPTSTLGPASPIRRVLVPLDDAPGTTERLQDTATTVAAAGAELIALHVMDPAHVPQCLDTEGHGLEAYRHGFRARHAHVTGPRLELRRGPAWQAIRRCLDEFEIDVLLLSWDQRREEGHARLVQRALRESRVPVLLTPPRPGPVPVPP